MAVDPAKLADPSLIIYAPGAARWAVPIIVTNGDQTDTIYDADDGRARALRDALRTRTFEPDAPNYTPRICCRGVRWTASFRWR